MNDWKCRNCGFRFIPTFWCEGVPGTMVGQCPKCYSNATHEIIKGTEDSTYGVPKTTAGGTIRLDE